MKKVLVLLAAATLALSSCSVITTSAGVGSVYTDVTEGMTATSNSLGNKVGTSTAMGVLGIIATGDASIQTAAHSGGIKKISHVDVKKMSVLGIFSNFTTIVYGE